MARLPTRDDLGGLPSARSGRVIANYDTSAIGRGVAAGGEAAGRGLADLGASIAGAATDIARIGATAGSSRGIGGVSQAEQFEAQRKFLEFTSAQEQAYEESKGSVDPGAFGFREKAQQNYLNSAKEFFKSIPDALKPEYDMKLFQVEDNVLSKSRAFETTERVRYYGEEVNKGLGTLENNLFSNPGNFDKNYAEGVSFINAIPDESLSRIQKADLAKQWRTKAQLASLNGVTPQERIRLLGGVPDEPTDGGKPSPSSARLSHAVYGRAQQASGYLKERHGLSPIAAAAVAGHAVQESGVQASGAVGDKGTAFGVFQWRGDRLVNLKQFASQQGKDWKDLATQLDFAAWEGQNGDAGARRAWAELQSAQTLEDAVAAWMHFERPQGYSASNPRGGHGYSSRLAAARRIAAGEAGGDTISALDQQGGIMNAQYDASRADPRFADMNYADAQKIIQGSQAEIEASKVEADRASALQVAANKAQYDQHKGSLELAIEAGDLNSERSILNDSVLTDAHKADLLKAFRSKMEGELATGEAVRMFNDGSLNVDPYDTKGKKTVDNVWGALTKAAAEETDMGPVAESLVRQTGTVPQQVVNSIRKGASSTNPDDIMNAAQTAQRIATVDPAALSRRDGGGEAQTLADDFSHYVNNLNMTPEEAAEKIATLNDPEKKRDRKALEPAAKEFAKEIEGEDLGAVFDESWAPFSDPDIGFTEGQALGIQAEYQAIAQEQFYKANGDVEVAKNRAKEEMKRLYGVTNLTGRAVVMKHPPERYWPKNTASEGAIFGIGADPLGYAKTQLYTELAERDADFDPNSVQFVTTPATEQMIKRGEMPGYSVFYTDKDGIVQTFPGQLWRPDFKPAQRAMQNRQERRVEDAAAADEFMRDAVAADESLRESLRGQPVDNSSDGNPMTGEPKPLTGGGGGY